jgi:hypothetical protein
MNYTASTVACFQDISGWCVNQWQDMSIKLFVR